MNRIKPLFRVPLLYGAIAGVLGGFIAIVLYYIGRHPFLFNVYFDFRIVLFAIFIFFTLKELRDIYQGGVLYVGQGLVSSFVFVTVFACLASFIIYLFGLFEDDFVKSFIQLFSEQTKSNSAEIIKQMGKDNFERNLQALQTTDSFAMARKYFIQCYMISFFISIILSVILRRQPKD